LAKRVERYRSGAKLLTFDAFVGLKSLHSYLRDSQAERAMKSRQKRSPRLSATGLFLILIIAYLITLLGAKDIFGYDTDHDGNRSSTKVVLSRTLSQ
jgi:hypothetical protein